MYQTFYVDIDEEITSIVEKLRKAETDEIVLVVPKRALLIQSIVNLKILKKEADNLSLKISIVTQDKLGKMLIQKAGIFIQQRVEDEMESLEDTEDPVPRNELKSKVETVKLEKANILDAKTRLGRLGSSSFFEQGNAPKEILPMPERERLNDLDSNDEQEDVPINVIKETNFSREYFDNKELLPPRRNNLSLVKKKKNVSMDVSSSFGVSVKQRRNEIKPTVVPSLSSERFSEKKQVNLDSDWQNVGRSVESAPQVRTEDKKDQQLEKFFYSSNFSSKASDGLVEKKKFKNVDTQDAGESSLLVKVLASLVAVSLFVAIAYGAYLYVPKAKIAVFAKSEISSSDLEISGNVNYTEIDYDKLVIPAKVMEFDEEVVKDFEATGTKNVSNQKAKGKITIYNEFSSSAQPLVATTRFLSDDQKIFRLVQGVTVPGTTKVGDEVKPGVVEVEVVADESGDTYNIGPTNFKIPGFQNSGNEKYNKIYAKSSSPMSGGGNGGEQIKVVLDKDINSIKDKISLEITDLIKKKIKESATPGTIILNDAIIIEEPVYRLSNSEGEAVEKSEIMINAHARALVFAESDVKRIANYIISKSGNRKVNIDSDSLIIDYRKTAIDMKLGTMQIGLHASNVMPPDIDLEALKAGALGKNNEELTEYLRTYPEIEKAEVEYFPQVFVSKVPLNEKRVEVVLNAIMP